MTDRTQGILNRASEAEKFSGVRWILGDGVITNYMQSFVDDTIKRNAIFQSNAGVSPKIVRRSPGWCCEWCAKLEGTYMYPDRVPDDVYRRHDNCNCVVEFYPADGKKQDVWTKEWTKAEPDTLKERKRLGEYKKVTVAQLEQRKTVGLNTEKKPVFIPAETIEDAKKYADETLGLRTSLDYKKMNIDVANIVNEELTKAYEIFGNLHEDGVLEQLWLVTGKKPFVAAYNGPMKTLIFTRENTGFKSSLKKMQKNAIFQKDAGFWSTGNKEQSIRHEIGHAVERKYYRGNEELEKAITEIRMAEWERIGIDEWSMETPLDVIKKGGEKLSFYGLLDNSEFIAESVAEYMSGEPRETARKVVELLLK